jgi:hypothetical protein
MLGQAQGQLVVFGLKLGLEVAGVGIVFGDLAGELILRSLRGAAVPRLSGYSTISRIRRTLIRSAACWSGIGILRNGGEVAEASEALGADAVGA